MRETAQGESIDRFRLLGRLGAGGMGQVYLGAAADGHHVAIKVVHPALADDDHFRARFRREVAISRRVAGPSVAAVVDADPDAEQPWLAVEYVPGPSLQQAVTEAGPLTVGAVRRLGDGLAEACETIHAAGLVHRDLKPSNVLLDPQRPRLIDFGISRAVDGTALTSTGAVVGTPAFMSPEQISGEATGPASDVFSLGSVLCYAATGRGPFGEAASVVLMLRISTEEPDLSGVPEELRGPVAACLAKQPDARPTPGELRRMLVPAPPADLGPPTPVTVGRRGLGRRALFGGIAAAGLAAAGVAGVAAYTGTTTPVASPSTATAPQPGTGGARVRWSAPLSGPVTGAVRDGDVLFLHSHEGGALAIDTATGGQLWSVPDLGPGRTSGVSPGPYASLARVGDALVVTTDSAMAAIDVPTARLLWTVPRSGDYYLQPLAAADGVAVAPQDRERPDGSFEFGVAEIVARDVATGDRIWAAPSGLPLLGVVPLAAVDELCVIGQEGLFEGRDLRTGSLAWTYQPDYELSNFVVAAPGAVVAGHSSAAVGLDPATGGQRWSADLSVATVGRVNGRYAVGADGDVLAAHVVGQPTVIAHDLRDGSLRWVASDAAWVEQVDVVAGDGAVFVLSDSGRLTALATDTGDELWAYDAKPTPTEARGRDLLAAGGGAVFLRQGLEVHAVGV